MWIMLLTIIVTCVILSGMCIDDPRIRHLISMPEFVHKDIVEVPLVEDTPDELDELVDMEAEDLTDGTSDSQQTIKMSEKNKVSVQDILNY